MKKRILIESLNLGVSSVCNKAIQEHRQKYTISDMEQESLRSLATLIQSLYAPFTIEQEAMERMGFTKVLSPLSRGTEPSWFYWNESTNLLLSEIQAKQILGLET